MIGDSLGQDGFESSDGFEFLVVGLAMLLIADGVVGWQQDGLAGESVADGVVAGECLSCISAGARGFLGVGLIGG